MAEEKEPEEPSETGEETSGKEKWDHMLDYAKSNTRDTVAYVLLILGIIWLIFDPRYGGLLIGMVFGFYFAPEIVELVRNARSFIEMEGVVKSLILGGTLLAFFILAPMIFIGAAVVASFCQLVLFRENK